MLLRAAGELARERGVDGATVSALCKRAGLPVSSVYWHFEDKDDIFASVIRDDFERWLDRHPHWRFERGQGVDVVTGLRRTLGETFGEELDRMPDFMRVGMQVLLDNRAEHARARAEFQAIRTEVHERLRGWIRDSLVREGLDEPDALAEQISVLYLALADGFVVSRQVYGSYEPRPHLELFLSAVEEMVAGARHCP